VGSNPARQECVLGTSSPLIDLTFIMNRFALWSLFYKLAYTVETKEIAAIKKRTVSNTSGSDGG